MTCPSRSHRSHRSHRASPRHHLLLGALACCALPACLDMDANEPPRLPSRKGEPADTWISKAPPPLTNLATARFEFGSDAAYPTFACEIPDQVSRACSSPFDITLPDGTYELSVRAKGATGPADLTPATARWTIDTTPPSVSLRLAPPVRDNSVRPRFEFTSEPGATMTCSVDHTAPSPCTSPLLVGPLGEGIHTLQVTAKDAAGNLQARPTEHRWEIDVTTPDTIIDEGPPARVASASATFRFSSSGAAEGSGFYCALGSAPAAPCTSPWSISDLPGGTYRARIHVKEQNGDEDPTPAEHTWTVDLTPPSITINAPVGPTADNTPTIAFLPLTSTPEAQVECRLLVAGSTAEFAPCTSPITSAELADGSVTFELRATDDLGNQASASRTFLIDTAAPALTLTSGPPALSNQTGATFRFTASADATTRCSLDAAPPTRCTSPTYQTVYDGSHVMEITASDAAGNTTSVTHTFAVDLYPPALTLTGPSGFITDPAPVVTFVAGSDAVTVECSLNYAAFTPCTSPQTLNLTAVGWQSFHVRAADAMGNTGTRAISFQADPRPLAITITSGPLGEINERSPQFAWTATGSTVVDCRWDAGQYSVCWANRYPELPDGPHTFAVRARNERGGVVIATQSFTVDTVAPLATITAGPTGTITDPSVTFEFTTSGAPVVTECRLFRQGAATGAYGPCASPHAPTLSPPELPYPYVFEVRVSDLAGNTWSAYRTFTLAAP